MKICLISPPYNSEDKSIVGVSSPQLGLAYIASMQTSEECKYIDIIVKGEGEETTKELIETIEKVAPLNGVKRITFRNKN